jgi:uncharacterized RmlC-like cupin family protein
MRATREQRPLLFGTEAAGIRGTDWGGVRIALVTIPAGADTAPLLKDLPDERCPCPHGGYVLEGRMRVTYADGEEIPMTGDLFYLPPGHDDDGRHPSDALGTGPVVRRRTHGSLVRPGRADRGAVRGDSLRPR